MGEQQPGVIIYSADPSNETVAKISVRGLGPDALHQLVRRVRNQGYFEGARVAVTGVIDLTAGDNSGVEFSPPAPRPQAEALGQLMAEAAGAESPEWCMAE
ncbi:MAG TPA: hypothetical protein VL737_03275 [Candidatus Pristimantibacillus sp.]|nr:hypothetical protein [Candidatus Pristimantibacillus sp.]